MSSRNIDPLTLLSGNDIPFYEANLIIHQPRIRDIAHLGEEKFLLAHQMFNISKDMFGEEDKERLSEINNFDILMSVISNESEKEQRENFLTLLFLIFPQYQINIDNDGIHFTMEDMVATINGENFDNLVAILNQMFDLGEKKKDAYNPKNEAAKKIAEKLKKGKEKVAELRGKPKEKIEVFSKFISVLAIGLNLDINVLMNYTLYQLTDSFKRFQMKQEYDTHFQALLAGATELQDVDYWMESIHS